MCCHGYSDTVDFPFAASALLLRFAKVHPHQPELCRDVVEVEFCHLADYSTQDLYQRIFSRAIRSQAAPKEYTPVAIEDMPYLEQSSTRINPDAYRLNWVSLTVLNK